MSWDTNIYDTPEKYGLEIIETLEDPNASYSFDTLIVLKHKETGRLYWAQDSGCSCPSPFESFDSMDELDQITDETWSEFQKSVEGHALPYQYGDEPKVDELAADKTECLSKVARLLRES